MSGMYPDISEEKLSPKIYPDLPESDDDDISSFETYPTLRKHSGTQKSKKLDPNPITEKNDETKESSSNFYKYIIAILTFFSSIIFLLYNYIYASLHHQKAGQSLPEYLKEIEKLKPNYGHQTDEFWNTVKSFPYYILSDINPQGPAVLLMVAPVGSLSMALKLTRQFTFTLNKLLNSDSKNLRFIEGTSLMDQNPDVQKIMIDKQIRTLVDSHQQKAIVVVNLEMIDPKAIMIFHGYCDNSEAVYKNIAIIFLVELPAGLEAKNKGDVYTHLSQIWSPLGQSRVRALLSRMANNIAILKGK